VQVARYVSFIFLVAQSLLLVDATMEVHDVLLTRMDEDESARESPHK
jgi:hypothetical protein